MNIGVTMKSMTLFAVIALSTAFMAAAQAQQQAPGKTPNTTAPRGAYGDAEFRLGPDDVIEVSVYQEKDLSTTVVVRPDGKISVALIGDMQASGKTAVELQREIAQRYS